MKITNICLALCLLALPAFSQEGGAAAPGEKPPGGNVRGLAFQLDSPPTEVYVHDAATDGRNLGVKLDVKNYLNFEFSSLPIRGKKIVFSKTPDPAGIKNPDNIVATTTLPDNFHSGILMFLPGTGKKDDPPFRVMVIDDSVRKFPAGSAMVLNLSPLGVRMEIEDETFLFKSGDRTVIEKIPVAANQMSSVTAYSFDAGKWQRIAATKWPHPGKKRVIQVLFYDPKTKKVELRGIRDVAGSNE